MAHRAFAGRLARESTLEGGLRGVIINVSSIGALDGVVGAVYAASKGGVEALGLSLARELGPRRIRVVTIAPGGIDTEMFRSGAVDGTYEAMRTMVPSLGRVGRPDEFAGLVVHICENDYLNGCTIRLDGGMRIPFSFDLGGGASRPT
jgi:NAD(P)-dependent dehydrogenase (short-subunit alcohol dehydrogenase family)